jgi:uncharacterized membrane protein YhaH (DUF805 family)
MTVQFCTQCGHAIGAHEKFCGMCGADVGAMTAVVDGPSARIHGSEAGTGRTEDGSPAAPFSAHDSSRTGSAEGGAGIGYLFFSSRGRINRKPYWLWNIPLIALSVLFELAARSSHSEAWYLLDLALVPASLMLGIKRAHDRNRSGWFLLLSFIPLLNLWPGIELGFMRGTVGTNDYGADPLAMAGLPARDPPPA